MIRPKEAQDTQVQKQNQARTQAQTQNQAHDLTHTHARTHIFTHAGTHTHAHAHTHTYRYTNKGCIVGWVGLVVRKYSEVYVNQITRLLRDLIIPFVR